MKSFPRFGLPGVIVGASCIAVLVLPGCGGGSARPVADVSPSMVLNDTGRATCSGSVTGSESIACPAPDAPGQDAQFGRDFQAASGALMKFGGGDAGFDFSKLGSDGMPLLIQDGRWSVDGAESMGTQWACVKDNTTGLIWEVKHPEPSHPRYALSTYNWYSADSAQNAGISGTRDLGECNAGLCDSEGYVDYLNSIALCGYSDWRMPSVSEFYSIGHKGREDPAIDTSYFPNTLDALRYWTGVSVAETPQVAWYMYFSDASISFTHKDNTSFLRLVRAEQEGK